MVFIIQNRKCFISRSTQIRKVRKTKRKHQIPSTHFSILSVNPSIQSPWCNRSSMTKPRSFLQNLLKPFKSLSSDRDTSKEDDLEQIAAQEQKAFSFDTLSTATRNFHFNNKLGEGGFGPVYKGKLEDGREIAVKKLARSSRQGKKEFINEAGLLAKVQHKNIVNLLGYCTHGVDCLLVYEYLPRQSLDKFLFRDPKKREELDWKKRYDIILGVAKGLVYLHEDSHICIIHRDIKAGNILLDDKWAPKIADFGMARLFPEDETHVNTRVAGTNGYMAPEYVMHGKLSSKADVFSFGVLVLELISGQKNSTFNADPDAHSLLEWAWNLYKKGRSLEIMDITLASTEAVEQVKTCIQIGLLCCQPDPAFRPLMRRVILMLSKKPSSLEEPQRPGYLGSRYRRPNNPSGSSSAAGSSGLTPHLKPAHFSSIAGSSGGSSGGSSSNTFNSTFNTGSAIRSPLHRSHEKKTSGFSSGTFNSTSNTDSAMRSPFHRSHEEKTSGFSLGTFNSTSNTDSGMRSPLHRSQGKKPMQD